MNDTGRIFLDRSRTILAAELMPRIEECVRQLSREDLWWRPNEASNSVANLMLHLAGNLRQWIVSGVGGAPDTRRRDEEFDERSPIDGQELSRLLGTTVAEAVRVLENFPPERLGEERLIQGRTVSVLGAIYHAVEHFSMHTGQIIYITKMRLERDLGFYEVVDGVPRERWRRPDL